MLKRIFHLFYRSYGWTLKTPPQEHISRCVVIAAPHTSNWDFIYGIVAFDLMKIPVRFTIKKEWLFFPFDMILKSLGAIGIDRSPKQGHRPSMVSAIAQLFEQQQELAVLVTPEGTRSRREKWRTGFYYIALEANVPIALGFLDYKEKVIGIGKIIYPSGNIHTDMQEIMQFYQTITPKFQEKFSVDKQYIKMNEGQ